MEIIKLGNTQGTVGTCKSCQTVYRYFDSDIQEEKLKVPIFIDDTYCIDYDYYKVKLIICPGCKRRIVLSRVKTTEFD